MHFNTERAPEPGDPAVQANFNIHDVFNSPEFDELLTDIEKSLNIEAGDKTGTLSTVTLLHFP